MYIYDLKGLRASIRLLNTNLFWWYDRGSGRKSKVIKVMSGEYKFETWWGRNNTVQVSHEDKKNIAVTKSGKISVGRANVKYDLKYQRLDTNIPSNPAPKTQLVQSVLPQFYQSTPSQSISNHSNNRSQSSNMHSNVHSNGSSNTTTNHSYFDDGAYGGYGGFGQYDAFDHNGNANGYSNGSQFVDYGMDCPLDPEDAEYDMEFDRGPGTGPYPQRNAQSLSQIGSQPVSQSDGQMELALNIRAPPPSVRVRKRTKPRSIGFLLKRQFKKYQDFWMMRPPHYKDDVVTFYKNPFFQPMLLKEENVRKLCDIPMFRDNALHQMDCHQITNSMLSDLRKVKVPMFGELGSRLSSNEWAADLKMKYFGVQRKRMKEMKRNPIDVDSMVMALKPIDSMMMTLKPIVSTESNVKDSDEVNDVDGAVEFDEEKNVEIEALELTMETPGIVVEEERENNTIQMQQTVETLFEGPKTKQSGEKVHDMMVDDGAESETAGRCRSWWNDGIDVEEITDRLLNDLVFTFEGKDVGVSNDGDEEVTNLFDPPPIPMTFCKDSHLVQY